MSRPWVMRQRWHDVLFMHWPVAPALVRPHVPDGLELQTFDGEAWIGVVPFRMSGIRLRWLPPIPFTSAFPELNVRTYVTDGEKPGVWFFSLDAHNVAAVAVARAWFRLPYFRAVMRCDTSEKGTAYASTRVHKGAPPAEFAGAYRPAGDATTAKPGTLDHWLTERYCLFAPGRKGLLRGDIEHEPWPLQPAEAEIIMNTMSPIELPDTAPLLHYARFMDVRLWAPARAPPTSSPTHAPNRPPPRS